MSVIVYHIDAFTHQIFSGNPAAVFLLEQWLPEEELTAIAKENNLPATAFLVKQNDDYQIRWITPEYELDICGHGSLAAGYVVLNILEPLRQSVIFHSKKESLSILKSDNLILLNFPAKKIEKLSELPGLLEGLGKKPKEIYQFQHERCFAVFDAEDDVKNLQPNMSALRKLPHRGISVTARGEQVDYVSRTFYPQKTMSEDPATGASHCLLMPYWSEQLGKTKLHSLQLSLRGGEMFCELKDGRVIIGGSAVLYMQGVYRK